MSTALSVMIAVYSLFIAAFIRSRLLRLLLYVAALIGIVLTTNKSTAAAYVLTLLMLIFTAYRFASAAAFLIAVLVGLMLPAISGVEPGPECGQQRHAARLVRRPADQQLAELHRRHAPRGLGLVGRGLRCGGQCRSRLSGARPELLVIADNTALYLWGCSACSACCSTCSAFL